MQLKKIGILVLAAAVLVAMTGSIASATTYDFNGYSKSTHKLESIPVYTNFVYNSNSPAYGHLSPSVGDYARWSAQFQNYDGDTHTAYDLYYPGSPATLSTVSNSVSVSGYNTASLTLTPKVLNTNYLCIYEQQEYVDSLGQITYTQDTNMNMEIN